MPKPLVLLYVFVTSLMRVFAQNQVEITVFGESQNTLEAATIVGENEGFWVTDAQGRASVSCECDRLVVKVAHVGYLTEIDTLNFKKSIYQVILSRDIHQLEEVVVDSRRTEILENPTEQIIFSPKAMNKTPFLLGVADPIKFVQLQTGVSTGTEGNNGYFVRGGGIDQNEILLDGMELYNPNHLLGFFSMFNPEAIENATFIKSGYPAEFGGRLSSVLDIRSVKPDLMKTFGKVGMGVLAVDGSMNLPVIQDKLGVVLAYRRSYLDLITQNLLSEENQLAQSTNYRFSDVLGKVLWLPNQKDKVSFTFFTGQDDSQYKNSKTFSNELNWKTMNMGFRLEHELNTQEYLELYSNYGNYNQQFAVNISSYQMFLHSTIRNWKSGIKWSKYTGSHEWSAGVSWNQRWFVPNEVDVLTGNSEFVLQQAREMPTGEWSVYFDDWILVDEKLRIGIGLRLSGFMQFGPFMRYVQNENAEVSDSSFTAKGKIVTQYQGLEPRLRLSYRLTSNGALKLSYDRTYQYIHLSPLSSVSLPSDLWVPSTSVILPQIGDQMSAGWSHVLNGVINNYNVSVFGKLLQNQMEWKNGVIAGYSDSPNLDDDLVFGNGYSYGGEFKASLEWRQTSLDVNYTLSKTMRKFAELNQGDPFPAKYDRTHDLNLSANVSLNHWTFSGLFKLASGTTLTLPKSKYLIGERVVSEYTERNGLRMHVYHRLDFSATLVPEKHPNAKWVFSIYNVYNRDNPYFIYFDVSGSVSDYSLDIDLEQMSLFPILPSVAYEIKF